MQYESILLMGCHPELSKRYQFNLTNNKNGELVNVQLNMSKISK